MKKIDCIMLIDDDEATNFHHQLIIEDNDCCKELVVFEYAEEALQYLKDGNKTTPTVIFLDINMPRMNGWEFLEEYKKLEEHQKSEIIMLTTSLNESDRERAAHINEISAFKHKPLMEEMLEKIMKKL